MSIMCEICKKPIKELETIYRCVECHWYIMKCYIHAESEDFPFFICKSCMRELTIKHAGG